MVDITIVAIIFITFILRILPGILGLINIYTGDINFHLLCAEEIVKNRYKCPKKLKNFILEGVYDYPPLFHYILALIPKAKREKHLFIISPLIDIIHVVIIYYFILYIIHFSKHIYNTDPNVAAATAALLFATSPALLYYGIGPRSYIATPRTLGELFISITFLSELVYLLDNDLTFFILACSFSAFTLLTSKFGGQVLIFFSIGLAVFLSRYEFALLPMIGILLAIIISNGKYIEILNGWVRHSILLKKIIIDKIPTFRQRNNLIPFKKLVNAVKYGDLDAFEIAVFDLINNNSYIVFITRNILFIILIKLIIDNLDFVKANYFTIFLSTWILISLIIFIITSLKSFLFLGEAERYLEHSISAQIVLFAVLNTSFQLFIVILVYSIIFYLGNLFMLYYSKRVTIDSRKASKDLINWFKTENITEMRILNINVDNFFIAYRTNNSVLWPPGNFTKIDKETFTYLWEELGWPNRNLRLLIDSYRINLVIVNNKNLDYASNKGWNYDLSNYRALYRNRFYVVYEPIDLFQRKRSLLES